LVPLPGLPAESIHLPHHPLQLDPSLGDDPGPLAKALAELVRTQYGNRLSQDDLVSITRQIQTGLERLQQLKKVELANSDEPDFIFTPTRRRS
jgi:hypothetical protein